MSWNLDSDRPIFAQIIEHIELDVISGKIPPGSRLASVSELAGEAAVNPNTMQRALGELERMGLMNNDPSAGHFVTNDLARIDEIRQKLAADKTQTYLGDMARLGFSRDEIAGMIADAG